MANVQHLVSLINIKSAVG